MKLIRFKHCLLIYSLVVLQICFLTSCNTKSYNSKHQIGKIGYLGFNLDMDYLKVKSTMDSLLNISDLQYFETTDILGTCLLYTSPSPRDRTRSRMPSSA